MTNGVQNARWFCLFLSRNDFAYLDYVMIFNDILKNLYIVTCSYCIMEIAKKVKSKHY